MKKFNFRKTFTVFALTLTLIFAAFLTGCGNGSGATSAGETDKHALAEAVAEFTSRSEIYAGGTLGMSNVRTDTYDSAKQTKKSAMTVNFSGGISYDDTTGEFGAFDADIFAFKTQPEEAGATSGIPASSLFIRDGLSYTYDLVDYKGNADGVKAAVKEKLDAGGKLSIFKEANLKETIILKLGLKDMPTAQIKEIEATVESFYSGLIKGASELAVITKNGSDYTLDITATLCEMIDKIAAAADAAYKNPDATVGEFYNMPAVKTILSPVLKNIKAQDALEILKMAIGEEYFRETAEGKLEAVISGVGTVVLDKPGAAVSLEDYLVKTVFEAGLDAGAAVIKIKDFKIGAIFGFGQDDGSDDGSGQSEEMVETAAPAGDDIDDIRKAKDDVLEVLPSAKITFTVESGKITRIKAKITTVSGGGIGSPDGIISSYRNEITITAEFDVFDKMPSLLDISKVEKEKPTSDSLT